MEHVMQVCLCGAESGGWAVQWVGRVVPCGSWSDDDNIIDDFPAVVWNAGDEMIEGLPHRQAGKNLVVLSDAGPVKGFAVAGVLNADEHVRLPRDLIDRCADLALRLFAHIHHVNLAGKRNVQDWSALGNERRSDRDENREKPTPHEPALQREDTSIVRPC
jgi:hypothetical protein